MSAADDVRTSAREYLDRLQRALDAVPVAAVEAVVARLHAAYLLGRKVLIIGNGGSAATASHLACDLSKAVVAGPGSESRRPFRVLSLTDNVPLITAWANDTDYTRVFVEQVRTHVDAGDVLVAISGSGRSPNVVEAVKVARRMGADTIGILGFDGGALGELVDAAVIVASDDYGVIEAVHVALHHTLTECLQRLVAAEESQRTPRS